MLESARTAQAWRSQGRTGVIARAVDGEGLGPRSVDELLLFDTEGRPSGALLGGLLDDDLAMHAKSLVRDGEISRLVRLAISPADADTAGLTCGGSVMVLLQPLARIPEALWTAISSRRPVALVTAVGADLDPLLIVPGDVVSGTLGDPALDEAATSQALATLAHPGVSRRRVKVGDVDLVVEGWSPPPRVLVAGITDLSRAIVQQAELLGWQADGVVAGDCPGLLSGLASSDAVIVLDHDHGVATRVLLDALRRGIGYVGALGSRRTQEARRHHLEAAGATEAEMGRLHGPTGLDLGARTPAETAVSIVAEILAARSGRQATALGRASGSIKA